MTRVTFAFLAGLVTAALLLLLAFLRGLSQTAIPIPYDETDEAGA